ncbi:hypothetical protein HBA55_36540 [Pseudomaricurvus alkylphenolicus]|uniref:hypothetical protein n=1 Tax=Pseudomaricurvus alkylphenolicus TaxID=1306991 RepID=UPI0014235A4B|nr:hypothetical protein [Pseudomaricurvus alkylphenolicus]NIB45145.1 hypothetical protein [Pseudomaricurvus alkylphenolicus]
MMIDVKKTAIAASLMLAIGGCNEEPPASSMESSPDVASSSKQQMDYSAQLNRLFEEYGAWQLSSNPMGAMLSGQLMTTWKGA